MKQLSLKKAKSLSKRKWEIIVEQNGSVDGIEDNPLFEKLAYNCGFCERHKIESVWSFNCDECEINMNLPKSEFDNSCTNENHPFKIWSDNQTKENAQKFLDIINSVKT
jgi:hypothetical protein